MNADLIFHFGNMLCWLDRPLPARIGRWHLTGFKSHSLPKHEEKHNRIFCTKPLGILCLALYVLGPRHQAVMEGRDSYDFGDSFGFLLLVIPIVFLCIVSNIAWGIMAALDIYRERNYRSVVAFVAVAVL